MHGTSVYTIHYNVSNNNTKTKKAKVSVSYEQKNNYY